MSSSQSFTDQPVPQFLQSASVVPFSNALPSVPPTAKKMQHVAFECSMRLRYPSISIMDCIPTSLPTGLQPIYEDTYLANLSPKVLDRIDVEEWKNIFQNYPSCEYCASHNLHSTCSLCPNSLSCTTCEANYPSSKKFCSFKSVFQLLQFHILAKLPLIVAYCIVSSRGLFIIWGGEWTALTMGLQNVPYYCSHPEELGLLSDRPRASEGKRKAVISSNAFQKSQLLRQEGMHLGEPSRKQVPTLSHKGKEVACDTVDVDVEMGAPEELDTMTLDYPEDVPPLPVPVLTPPAPVWKAIDNWSYHEVSSLKTWFFEPLIKRDPSDNSSSTRDKKHSKVENLCLQEQVASCDAQLKDQDEELNQLKSFVQHFTGDIQSMEVQQLRGAVEAWDGEIEELKKKLAAKLAQLRQLFKLVQGQFAAASPTKPSSSSS
ncbi:hypothetical protein GYMLUDRAFT_240556 [Collybiopsis luxurians FD-317 M1]|nr:hypothetical protein GYMLUDRAFT_240556 [Collybiopsis luxurians FD-317 M1]